MMSSGAGSAATISVEPDGVARAIYRYERIHSDTVHWAEVRELTTDEWDAVQDAHDEIYRVTRGLDGFLSFAWGDLRNVRDELVRQVREEAPSEWTAPLIEFRILSFSTTLKLYQEYVTAQVNRTGDEELKARVGSEFSELYDRSFGYRLIYSMRNAFQHGVRGLISLKATARLIDGSDTQVESEVHAYLAKDVFNSSRSNAAVRAQVRQIDEDIDLLALSEEVFFEIQNLHRRLIELLHPSAPAAARLLIRYIEELGGELPHFHAYMRGFPTQIFEIRTLDRVGFEYVAQHAGVRTSYEGRPPSDAFAVLPSYPSSRLSP